MSGRSGIIIMLVLAGTLVGTTGSQAQDAQKLTPEQQMQLEEQLSKCTEGAFKTLKGIDPKCHIECQVSCCPPKVKCELKC